MSEKTRARSPVSPGDVVGGKYRVDKVLGAGGMGVVVAATHVELGQPVALKFVLPEALSGQGAVERFMREARAAVRLKSEHVARVFDVGRDGEDRPYMVLELLEGLDLARLNKQRGPFAIADSVEYVLQACEALVEAHSAGIVHRDLKPHNLFVTRQLNGAPLVKVLDFGIAKAIGPAAIGQMSLTDSAAVIGSPLYMAPEQMRSARLADARSDIWALGVMLYELLGGALPFDGETVTELCICVVNETPKRLDALRPGLDPALVTIVMRCLEKSPDARFQNVAQLAAALEPFSRSAQQGGPLRPWRSFEDTQDSGERPNQAILADDTGPSTAVTMPSAQPPGGAASPQPLASTDVAWNRGAESSAQGAPRPRSFAKGLAAGIVVSIAVTAAAAAVLFRMSGASRETVGTTSTPPTTAEALAPPAPPSVEPPPPAVEAPSAPAMSVAELPSVEPVRKHRSRPASPSKGAAKTVAEASSASSTPASAPAATASAKKAAGPEPTPNGAPILR